jgi:hypothetical protein
MSQSVSTKHRSSECAVEHHRKDGNEQLGEQLEVQILAAELNEGREDSDWSWLTRQRIKMAWNTLTIAIEVKDHATVQCPGVFTMSDLKVGICTWHGHVAGRGFLYSGSDSANITAGLRQHAARSHSSPGNGFEKLGVVILSPLRRLRATSRRWRCQVLQEV